MSSVKDLTGGTGDVNPQILNLTVTQTAADAPTTLENPLPVPRTGVKKGRAIVVEILWVDFFVDDILFQAGATSVTAVLSTSSTAITVADPRTFAVFDRDITNATNVGLWETSRIGHFVLNDSAGHGILIATDSVFLTAISVGTLRANSINCKIFYRFKEVALEEYIGIVAGQQ